MSDTPLFSRRAMLQGSTAGFGYLAFAGLSAFAAQSEKNPLAPKKPHFPAKAKRVIFLCMEGGPSHVDTFDYKPQLEKDDGKTGRGRFGKLLKSPWKFKQQGKSGLYISELFPELGKQADHLCLVNSMWTDQPNHPQAFQQMHTGLFNFRRPSMGSWIVYGLGTGNDNLPGFVTISPPTNNGGPANYGNAFLPAIYQGTKIAGGLGRGFGGGGGIGGRGGASTPSVGNIKNPKLSTSAQRAQLDLLQEMNKETLERDRVNPNVEGIIESYELAFRMQAELPGVLNLDKESAATKKLYGIGEGNTDTFGRQCLMARRMVESGVRFVEICQRGWDHHTNLKEGHERNAAAIDRPMAGLIADLASKGLLKDTLVMWGGEFGRTPHGQSGNGRDHNNRGYSIWMAGGGAKGGLTYGKTDEYGYAAVENKMHIHDWHATVLHLLGLDHEKLTYRYAGRDFRLTDVKGKVAKGIVA